MASNFMNEVYNDGFASEFSVSMLKETIALAWDYVSEMIMYHIVHIILGLLVSRGC